jgi:peptidyl-prolyl cis-trans isomerase D
MITWMQRHKKWLVITIWVSTIAFVGAGFVGWGSYKYGSSSGAVALVGNKKIKISDLQDEYNILYAKYQDALGDSFNQEVAKQFNLQKIAYDMLVQKFILLNYASDLGLYITDEEVAKTLVKVEAFLKNGKFNKDIYLKVLKQNRTNPTDFENKIKQDLLAKKIQTILKTKLTKNEIDNIGILNSITDRVSINIIESKKIKVDVSEAKIKNYWSINKENYKSLQKYKIAISKIKITSDEKSSKKIALKKYLNLKKGNLSFDETLVVDQNSNMIIPNEIGKVAKPIKYNGNYVIVKLLEKQPSKILPFNKVKTLVKKDYIANQRQFLLRDKVDELKANFKGVDIGFVSQNTKEKISSLTDFQTRQLINHILNSNEIINYIIFDDKAVVYKITDSKFAQNLRVKDNFEMETLLQNIKNTTITTNLIKQLQNRYEIISNMRVN